MKVAVMFTYGVSLLDWKNLGILERELKLYRLLKEKYNYKFTLITFGDSDDIVLAKDFEVVPVYKNIKKYNNKIINFLNSLFIPFKLKTTFKEIDLLKTNQLNGVWVSVIAKLLFNNKLIVRSGFDIVEFSKKNKKGFLKVTFYRLQKYLGLLFSNIYLVSNIEDKRNFFIKPKKIVIRNNWVEAINDSSIHNRNNRNLILVGRLENQKNYLKLFDNLSGDFSVEIYGEGSLRKSIIEKATSNNIKLNIYENITNELLLEILSKHLFFINYSKFEGSPKSLLEAMASGCIVIALNTKNNRTIIQNKVNGFLVEENQNLDLFLNLLLKNFKELEQISKNAKAFIKEYHFLDKIIEEEHRDYQNLK